MPAVQVMNRELSTFEDLQKTLGQLGITSGNTMLRLSFKNSGRPLEDAMKEITEYFKEEQSSEISAALAADAAAAEASKSVPVTEAPATVIPEKEPTSEEATEPMSDVLPTTTEQTSLDTPTSEPPIPSDAATSSEPPARKTAVFSAPSTTVPLAATIPHNENDYLPTIDHAKLHQSRLADSSKNRRLPSDAEIAATQKIKTDKLSTVEQINVRVRLPDQTQVQTVFGRAETSADLWGWVRLTLRHPEEEFILKHLDSKGKHVPLSPDSTKKLIQDLGWTGSTLIYMTWGDNVSAAAKKEPSLNDENLTQATELKASLPQPEVEVEEKKGFGSALKGMLGNNKGKGKALSPGEREEKLKRMMGFGKK
jgi:tether containing UBX domain for GLUT4